MRTFLEKVRNKLSDLGDDISFLKRKDVSWRFKILNLISGDRLRFDLAISCMDIHQSTEWLDNFYEFVEQYPDTSKEEIISFLKACEWRVRRVNKDLLDIWKI